jgi:hypothetical protein
MHSRMKITHQFASNARWLVALSKIFICYLFLVAHSIGILLPNNAEDVNNSISWMRPDFVTHSQNALVVKWSLSILATNSNALLVLA